MNLNDYKNSIKKIIETTNNEALLKHWKKQLEWDIQNQEEIELTQEEWKLVEEGLEDYKNNAVLSFEEFLKKR